jgi:hypothetical protein
VSAWLVECMTRGMAGLLERVPVVVDATVSADWSGAALGANESKGGGPSVTTMTPKFMHLWLRGDTVYCLTCGLDTGDVEFVAPGEPLCGDCRRRDPDDRFAAPLRCPKHRRERQ